MTKQSTPKWQWTGEDKIDLSKFNEKAAEKLIGKTVLIGKTYQDSDGKVLKRTQQHGEIVQVQRTGGIAIQLHNSEEIVWLPPTMEGWWHAEPGVYTSKTTGETVEDPDYITNWIVKI